MEGKRKILIVFFLFHRFLEPLVPSYMYNKLTAFKSGARSGSADCGEFKCNLPFFKK